jgi:hypothetical protein
MDGFPEFLLETYPAHLAQALAARAERNEAHRQACERQSRSPLLTLPREIRDKIWDEAIRGSIIHVQAKRDSAFDTFFSSKRRKTRTYRFYACRAEKGLDSLACPAGEGDHADCAKVRGHFLFISLRFLEPWMKFLLLAMFSLEEKRLQQIVSQVMRL